MSRISHLKIAAVLTLVSSAIGAAPAFGASSSSYCDGVRANALRSLGSAGAQRPLSAPAQKKFVSALKYCALQLDLTDYAPNLKLSDVISSVDLEMGRA